MANSPRPQSPVESHHQQHSSSAPKYNTTRHLSEAVLFVHVLSGRLLRHPDGVAVLLELALDVLLGVVSADDEEVGLDVELCQQLEEHLEVLNGFILGGRK